MILSNFLLLIFNAVSRVLSIAHTNQIRFFGNHIVIGNGSVVHFRSRIFNLSRSGNVTIGENCRLGCSSKLYHSGLPFYAKILIDSEDGSVEIGSNSRVNGAYIHAKKRIVIGRNCVIAAGVHIMDSNGHEVYSLDRTKGCDEPEEIVIGDNVWIGLNAIILKDTHIGNNSVVAAGSVVKGDFPPYAVISGNPAQIVKILDKMKCKLNRSTINNSV